MPINIKAGVLKYKNENGEYVDIGTVKSHDIISEGIPISQKGVANGVATLDNSAKVPTAQLPNTIVLTSQKGVANGVAALDSSGMMMSNQLKPATSSIRGGIKLGFSSESKINYALKTADEKAYVTVPTVRDTSFSGDIDTLTTPGCYYLSGARSTAGDLTGLYGTLFVNGSNNDDFSISNGRGTQIFIRVTNGDYAMMFRRLNADGWNPMKKIVATLDGFPQNFSFTTYDRVEQLGLTDGSATILDVFNAMPASSIFIGVGQSFENSELPILGATSRQQTIEIIIIKPYEPTRSTITARSKNGRHEWRMGLYGTAYNSNNSNKPSGEWIAQMSHVRLFSSSSGATLTHTFESNVGFVAITFRSGTTQAGAFGLYIGYAGSSNSLLVPVLAASSGASLSISGLDLTLTTSAVNTGVNIIELW